MTEDFTWDETSSLRAEKIAAATLPRRFALTAPQIVVRRSAEVLLVDPHTEGSWETWMFPYASLILTTEDLARPETAATRASTLVPGSTLGDLAKALDELRGIHYPRYRAAILEEVDRVSAGLKDGWDGECIYRNYSLKFSKSSDSFTAYAFEYFLNRVADISPDLPFIWVRPDQIDVESLDGKKVASNVRDVADRLQAISL